MCKSFNLKLIVIATVISCLFSCEDEPKKLYTLSGVTQKGPYILDSEISIEELNRKLQPTGKILTTTTQNNLGFYQLANTSFASNFVLLKVDGLYFSEIHGSIVSNELRLEALADLSESSEININLLTHLIRPRIEKLIQDENKSFKDARNQAEKELLTFFSWENNDVPNFSTLNLLENNSGGALLLAASSIFDFLMQDGDLNDYVAWLGLISDFKADLADNGQIDSERIQNKLLTTASLVDPIKVKNSLELQYSTTIPDISPLINFFIENSTFVNYFDNIFPESASGYINLLLLSNGAILSPGINYAIIVTPPQDNLQFYISVEIRKKLCDANDCFDATSELWSSQTNSNYNLLLSHSNKSDILIPITTSGNGSIDLSIGKNVDRIYPLSEPDKKIYW